MSNDKKFKTESGVAVSPFSRNLMGLKFMQNARNKLNQSEPEPAISQDKWPNLANPSYQNCEPLKLGRMSFGGMNPEIETLMKLDREARSSSKK